jgi:nucleotide-binding universal stress UspA family protein
MFKPRRILHPTDFSEQSNYALAIAIDLARQNQSSIIVLHTVPSLDTAPVSYGEVAAELEPEGLRRRIEEDLRHSAAVPNGINVEYMIAEGEPAREIIRVARERSCDVIVMGTHGRTGISHLMMGSVAEHVIRLAPCPVLTAKVAQAEHSAS